MTHILQNPIVIIIAVLVLAVVILVTAVFLFRSSGKKKKAKADKAALPDWQRQGQQGTAGTWNQPGVGGQADNWAQQQPGAWPAQQQPGAWAAQPAQQQPAEWGSAASNASPAGAGIGGSQPSWGAADATFMPQKSTPAAQDPWGQSQSAPPQQGGDVWGMQSSSPSQQQAPTSYSAGGSGQSWAQSGKPASPAPTNEPWGQPAPSQQPAWGQQPSGQQVSSPPATSYNANASPPWQQGPGQGPAFGGPPPAGFGAPAMQPDAASLFANNDNDKTMLRPSGPQGTLGMVRIEEGKEPGRVYEVRKEELSIGRSRESDIFLEDLAVSRLHAKIVSLGNGNYALKDEGSANGTKVNGQVVNKYQTYPLQEGDRIQLGQTVLVFAKR